MTIKDRQLETIGVGGAIDLQIRTFIDVQAALWNAYDKLSRAEDMDEVEGHAGGEMLPRKAEPLPSLTRDAGVVHASSGHESRDAVSLSFLRW